MKPYHPRVTHRLNALAVAGIVMMLAATSGHANACSHIRAWLKPPFDPPQIQPSDKQVAGTTDAAACSVALSQSGTKSSYCAWPFAYRDTRATQMFEEVTGLLEHCIGPQDTSTQNAPVNHPDSYEQRLFRVQYGRVSLSLKDKAQLARTYVFLRLDVTP